MSGNVSWWRAPADRIFSDALWSSIPDVGVPFVRFRRHHGLAWVRWKQNRPDAERHARLAVQIAGDGGLLRLRASALSLLARLVPAEAAALEVRSASILARLE